MPVPKRKVSKARRDKKFANKGMTLTNAIACQTCQAPVLSHQLCWSCGYYKGVKVLKTKSDRAHERTQTRRAKEETASAKKQEVAQGTEESKSSK